MNEIVNHETGEIVEHDHLAAALAVAQGQMQNAPLNRTNPHYRSKYADLAAIRDATIPALSKNGLALSQTIHMHDEKTIVLRTTLRHASGQYLQSEYPIFLGKPQEVGSALTYAKRYSWASICGISADDDDDAEGAGSNTPKPSRKPQPPDIEEIERQREEMDQQYSDTMREDRAVAHQAAAVGAMVGTTPPEPEKPHLIKLPVFADPYKAWGNWCRMFVGKLNAAKTLTEFNAWVMNNEEMRGALADFCEGREDDAKGWHEQLKKDAQAISAKFGPGEP